MGEFDHSPANFCIRNKLVLSKISLNGKMYLNFKYEKLSCLFKKTTSKLSFSKNIYPEKTVENNKSKKVNTRYFYQIFKICNLFCNPTIFKQFLID